MNFYLDFEATQFSQRIISIGCTAENGETFSTLVKPVKDEKVNDFITNLTGITNEMLVDAPSADEAFNNFFDWVIANNDNTMPQYFCYGNNDKDFIEHTVKYMTDIRAISFAISLKTMLIDYSVTVKHYLCTKQIALKKVVALIEKTDEVEQRHDALEDAEMLRKVVENLQTKCSPADVERLEIMKSTEKPTKRKAPSIFLSWPNRPKDKFIADTLADEINYTVKCESGSAIKYFNNIDTATLWAIKYLMQGKSPKKTSDIDAIKYRISNAITSGNRYCGFYWETKK